MSLPITLLHLGIAEVFGISSKDVLRGIAERFTDHSQAIPNAIIAANRQTWRVIGLALGQDNFLARQIRETDLENLRKAITTAFGGVSPESRNQASVELAALHRKLQSDSPLQQRVDDLARYAGLAEQAENALQALEKIPESLSSQAPELSSLLVLPFAGKPLLKGVYLFFFGRIVDKNPELINGLSRTMMETIAQQARGFALLDDRTVGILDQIDLLHESVDDLSGQLDSGFADIGGKQDKHSELLQKIVLEVTEPRMQVDGLAWTLEQMHRKLDQGSSALKNTQMHPAFMRFNAKLADADRFLDAWCQFEAGLVAVLTDRLASGVPAQVERAAELDEKRIAWAAELAAARAKLHRELLRPLLRFATTGTTSSGKSTLINLLCGAELMPVSRGEMSAGVVTIHHSSERRLRIVSTGGACWECGEWTGQSDDEIRGLLTQVMDLHNARRNDLDEWRQKNPETPCEELQCPQIELWYPTRLGLYPELLDLPEGCSYVLLDLPGLKYVNDAGNKRVIQEHCREAMSFVVYNAAETDSEKQKTLLSQVVEQVKLLGSSPARMLFLLNRIDELKKDQDSERRTRELVQCTTTAIRTEVASSLPGYADAADRIVPLKLSTMAALLAQQLVEANETVATSSAERLDLDYKRLIPQALDRALPKYSEDWNERQRKMVSDAVLETSHAKAFYTTLREHVRLHLPELVLPQAVDHFRAAVGRAAVEWALFTTRAEVNASHDRFEAERKRIDGVRLRLAELLAESHRKLRGPFEYLQMATKGARLSHEAGIKELFLEVHVTLQDMVKEGPYSQLPANAMAPLWVWYDDLKRTVENFLHTVGDALLNGKPLVGVVIDSLPHSSRRGLIDACVALKEAGYSGKLARSGGAVRVEGNTINAALTVLSQKLCPAMEDLVAQTSCNSFDRIFTAMQVLFEYHKQFVADGANAEAPGLGLELPEAQLEKGRSESAAPDYEYDVKVVTEKKIEQVQMGVEQVQEGTKRVETKTGERSRINPWRWFGWKDIVRVDMIPIMVTRPKYVTNTYSEAIVPSVEKLIGGWLTQTRQRDPELILNFMNWLLKQADLVKEGIGEFQKQLLDRYLNELDRAHKAARDVSTKEQDRWGAVSKLAEIVNEKYVEFDNWGARHDAR